MVRQNQMMQQQRMAQQRQAARAAQRQRQQAMQRQQQQRQRAIHAQRQRAQQAMQQRRQAIANQRAALQKRQRALQQKRLSSIKARQSNSPKVLVKPNNSATKSNVAQTRTLRQQKLAKSRAEKLRKLRLQREKKQRDKEKKDREDKAEQQDAKKNDSDLSLAAVAIRSKPLMAQPIIRPKITTTFKQARLSNRTNTQLVSQQFKRQREFVQARAKQLKSLSRNKLKANSKTDLQAKQKTQKAAAKNFGACDPKTKKCTCSFHGETGVLTSNGIVKISEITAGDTFVWSKNDKSGERSWQRVLEQYSNHYTSQIHIELSSAASDSGQIIISNKIHPFFVVQAGLQPVSSNGGFSSPGSWVQAQDLRSGDVLLNSDNAFVDVVRVFEEQKPFEAFNLHVANNHTYFVSADISTDNFTVWVHNDCNSPKNSQKSNSIVVTSTGVAVTAKTLASQGTSNKAGNFKNLKGKSIDEIVARIPRDWKMVKQNTGAGIKFLDTKGYERIRLHGPSSRAPAGSNSSSGWIMRVMDRTGKYYDNTGNRVPPRNNAGHIPIKGNIVLK